jgi:hypothetical protein
MSSLILDLSSQPEHQPCTTHHGAHSTTIRCHPPLHHLKRNSVLVEWTRNAMPGFRLARASGTPVRIGGRRAREQVRADTCGIGAARSITADIGVPGGNSYILFRACMSGPNPDRQEHRIQELLATVHWRVWPRP